MHYTSPEVYKHISKQTNDPIVERKTCEISGQKFPIFQSDLEFYDKISPTFDGKKYQIPTPRLCPEERNKKRIQFRNDSKIYRRKCDATGETFISMYSPEKKYTVYSQNFRHSDKRSAMNYGFDFDFSKSFVDQFEKLSNSVPKLGMQLKDAENSDYCCVATGPKNCYLSNVCSRSENTHYSTWITHSKDCVDCYRCSYLENSYNSILCTDSYNLQYCILCDDCSKCDYSSQLQGCHDCFMCTNLVNKQYYYKNKQYLRQKYLEIIERKKLESKEELKAEMEEFMNINTINHPNNNKNSNNSTGGFLIKSNNMKICFDIITGENCSYYFDGGSQENYSCDCSYGGDNELCFESLSAVGYKNIFTTFCWESSNIIYSDMCISCQNCFACIGLHNKQYCIFNKQYTKEEYNNLIPKIIKKMVEEGIRGDFFHTDLSPFGYNETVAQEYFPLTRQEALDKGYKRQDNNYDLVIPEHVQTLKGDQIPSDISTVTEEILKKILICEISERPFRIVKQELDFYKKHNLQLPRRHPNIRHQERLKQRPARELHLRNCNKCDKEIISIYSKEKYPSNILCETCYKEEIY